MLQTSDKIWWRYFKKITLKCYERFFDFFSDWMTPPELIAAGYNVELNYKPYIPAEELIDLQEQVRF
jgi:hypothetical protein